jgi:cytochrome c2
MSHHLQIVKRFFSRSALVFLFFFLVGSANAQDGKKIFNQKCATCHSLTKDITGPALAGIEERGPWSDRKKLYAWIHNPAGFMANDSYTQALKDKFHGIIMTGFPDLTEAEIDAIVTYINTPPAKPEGVQALPAAQPQSDNTLLFGVLTLILAIVALTLLRINNNLRKMSDDKEGLPAQTPVPAWRNKTYIATGIIILFLIGGYCLVQGAVGLGRQQNYQPDQPVYFSHKVHAGINQINCLYCHTGAQEGKQATIPSVNVCMNCHAAINTYEKGPKLVKANGAEVNGTAEIKKLYSYAGWDDTKQQYTGNGKPIEWVRIHNLPDHVYFNHAQHVAVGQQQCQTCHGSITEMDEVKQFSDLSMGWCVNCHRTTKVQFNDNKFYSIYEKFHEDIRNKKIDSVTVEMIGGLECQKCHY